MKYLISFLFIMVSVTACDQKDSKSSKITFEKSSIEVVRQGKDPLLLVVEMADTHEKRMHGLMYRTDLPENQGMLFEFSKPQRIGMWMANTPLSLDMIFIDETGKVTEIISGTVPFSRDLIQAEYKNKAVLEMHAGSAERLGIQEKDIIRHPIFTLEK